MNLRRLLNNCFKIILAKAGKKLLPKQSCSLSLKAILDKNFPVSSAFSFIQVGANDGVTNDYLFDFAIKRNSTGLVIEPLKEFYDKLVINYQKFTGIIPVNRAVHATAKEVTLYKLTSEGLAKMPSWASGIASLNPSHYQKSGTPKEYITTEQTPAAHLMHIVNQHKIHGLIDLLQIDVEGYDYEIIKQVDFLQLQPTIIRYEYMNLTREETIASMQYLNKQGYYCFQEEIDVIAVNLKRIKL